MTDFIEIQLGNTQRLAVAGSYCSRQVQPLLESGTDTEILSPTPFDWANECLELVDVDQRLPLAARLCLRADNTGQKNYPTDAWVVMADAAAKDGMTVGRLLAKHSRLA